jgi:kinetochore protein Mis12/MTW1
VQPDITPESLQLLRRKLQETRKMHNALQSVATRNKSLIEQLRRLTSPTSPGEQGTPGAFSFLSHGSSAEQLGLTPSARSAASGTTYGSSPLETNTSFALSQLPALHQLLAELRPRLATLARDSALAAPESGTARERRIFVERQSRKALDRQGFGTGDGAADSLGKAVDPDELAALEGIVESLNNNGHDTMEED